MRERGKNQPTDFDRKRNNIEINGRRRREREGSLRTTFLRICPSIYKKQALTHTNPHVPPLVVIPFVHREKTHTKKGKYRKRKRNFSDINIYSTSRKKRREREKEVEEVLI
jgi:hypothetical protein